MGEPYSDDGLVNREPTGAELCIARAGLEGCNGAELCESPDAGDEAEVPEEDAADGLAASRTPEVFIASPRESPLVGCICARERTRRVPAPYVGITAVWPRWSQTNQT